MKKIETVLKAAVFAALVVAAASCSKLDVVGTDSIASFDKVLRQIPQSVAADEMNGGWSLAAPDNSARFIWSSDYANSPLHDVMLELDAAPFIAAGLNPELLPENYVFYQDDPAMHADESAAPNYKLMVGSKLGTEALKYAGEVTPLASYEQIVKHKRKTIGYHGALDHYGVNLGDGNLFEWAKDLAANDKDIVFVLNPAPLIAAGLDPARVEGWLFTKVTVDDENDKPIEVDKILKPFNLL